MGLFVVFKLHLICNEKGELLNFTVTPDDVDDSPPIENYKVVERSFDKFTADKVYISKDLFQGYL